MIDNASPLSRSGGAVIALIVGLICALQLNPNACRAQDAPAVRDRPVNEAGLPATLKPGDVVTFVNADGQRIALTVETITPKSTTTEAQPAEAKTIEKKEPSKRTAGSDHVAGAAEKLRPSEERFRKLSTEFAVPDSPAAHVLGVAPEQVIHAETPKQLVTALINGLDEHGNLQNGFALDFAPMQIYLGRDRDQDGKTDLQVYASGSKGIFSDGGITQYFLRVLGRTQLSFATVRGSTDDDKSGKFALGLHTTFIDAKDRALLARLSDIRGPELESLSGPTLNELAANYGETKGMERARFEENALGKVANFLWDHASWSMGAAPAWIAEDAETADYHWNGLTAWSTFSLSWKPTEQSWMWPLDFLLHFRYRSDEKIPVADALPLGAGFKTDPTETFVNQDSWLGVAGLRFGRKDFFVTGTATYTNLRQSRRGSDDTFRYTVALEKKISSGTWLTLSLGTETGAENEEKPLLVLAGVKLGLDGESFSEH